MKQIGCKVVIDWFHPWSVWIYWRSSRWRFLFFMRSLSIKIVLDLILSINDLLFVLNQLFILSELVLFVLIKHLNDRTIECKHLRNSVRKAEKDAIGKLKEVHQENAIVRDLIDWVQERSTNPSNYPSNHFKNTPRKYHNF